MKHRLARTVSAGVLAVSLIVLVPVVAGAHPLGNFTVNQFSGITVRSDGVDITYVLDMAEIPTAQLLSELDTDQSHLLGQAASDGYQRSECNVIRDAVSLRVGDATAPLTVASHVLSFPNGAAGLHTLRLTCHLTTAGATTTVGRSLLYTNSNFDDRVGWREITALGTSAQVTNSSVPASSVSAQLTVYPTDLLASPLDLRSAALSVVAGAGGGGEGPGPTGPSGILPRGVDQFTNAFVGLIARQDMDVAFVLLALGAALVLGGVHAFAPGHGKTLMAAYLVGQRGSLRHAAALVGSVTLTHTLGVLALGVALSLSTSFAPTQVYPILGLASGLIVVSIGASLLVRAWRARAPAHPGTHAHSHGGRPHTHVPEQGQRPRLRGMLAIGFAGGLVPSPSALLVLVGGIALHRVWFAVLLVVVYGVGMAVVLAATGLALRHARTLVDRRIAARRSLRGGAVLSRLGTALPIVTAAVVVAVGLGLTLRGVTSI
jgi:nickel/cobalt exporter